MESEIGNKKQRRQAVVEAPPNADGASDLVTSKRDASRMKDPAWPYDDKDYSNQACKYCVSQVADLNATKYEDLLFRTFKCQGIFCASRKKM